MQSPRSQQLRKLASAEAPAAQAQSEAQLGSIKNLLASKPRLSRLEQEQLTNEAGQADIQTQAKAADQALQLTRQAQEVELQDFTQESERELQFRQQELQQLQLQQTANLTRLDRDLSNKLLSANYKFQKNQWEKTEFNQRQLLDWAVTQTKNEEAFENYRMDMLQQQSRKLELMKIAYQKIEAAMQQEYTKDAQEQNQAVKQQLYTLHKQMKEKIAAEQTKARNRSMLWQVGGSILGGIAGLAIGVGSPAAGAMGATLGGGLGTAIGGATA